LCLSLLWLLKPVTHPAQLAKQSIKSNNVPPGTNRAVLTLSNGKRVLLDSVPGGKIATQGGATVTRLGNAVNYTRSGADSGELLYNTITTPKGGQYAIVLADGSKVWLNSASSLRFPAVFKGNERKVELEGEGYFEIQKNARMPFTVSVGQMNVQVLGTHFDIMAYSDESTINTTLLEGAVAVRAGEQVQRPLPGQQVALGAGHRMVLRQADIEKTMAWKNGFFEFDQMDLAAIMRQVARWYDVEIFYQTAPDHTPLGGSISKGLSLAEVLNLLEADGLHHFKIEGKKVYVN
jgi:ferric-dicitrate binding protein FerR (iron transport regulator)